MQNKETLNGNLFTARTWLWFERESDKNATYNRFKSFRSHICLNPKPNYSLIESKTNKTNEKKFHKFIWILSDDFQILCK